MTDSPPQDSGIGFKLAVMWILIIAFLLALPMMFVHPSIPIMLFWFGLIVLAVISGFGWLMVRARQASARHSLRHHKCPHCHAEINEDPAATGEWHCQECGANYLSTGAEQPPVATNP